LEGKSPKLIERQEKEAFIKGMNAKINRKMSKSGFHQVDERQNKQKNEQKWFSSSR